MTDVDEGGRPTSPIGSMIGSAGPAGGTADESTPADSETSSEQSTTSAAKERSQQVAGTAKDEAADLMDSAKEQAGAVASEVKDQGRRLADEAQEQIASQAGDQRDRLVEQLRAVGDELSSMSEDVESPGLATQLAREGTDWSRRAADFLEQRDPGELLDEVRSLARRRPGTFLLGAAVAGLVFGRLTRGVAAARSSDHDASSSPSVDKSGAKSTSGWESAPGTTSMTAEGTRASDVGDAWGPASATYPASSETRPPTGDPS